MRAEPEALGRDLIATTLEQRWGIIPDVVDYLPIGGGGHHWRAMVDQSWRWFVTANGLVDRGHWLEPDRDSIYTRTEIAYETVRDLALAFALPPIPDRTGALLYRIHPDWALSVYPYLDAVDVAEEEAQQAIAGFVGQLHTLAAPVNVPRWRSKLPQRRHLERALVELEHPWTAGPYGEPTRAVVDSRHAHLTDLLHRYDQLATAVEADSEPWVLTHGEPNGGNTLLTSTGTVLLIDWDTLAIAPRERDLWHLVDGPTGPAWDAYLVASGCAVKLRSAFMEFFPLWWRLADIGSRIHRFLRPHVGDADDEAAWQNLESSIG